MSRFGLYISRPVLALAISLGLIGLTVGVVAAKPAGKCTEKIAGTYYTPADLLMTLEPDGSLSGQFSMTSQALLDGPGLGETFFGRWTCKGNDVTIQDFRFFDASGFRAIEQVDGAGTFDGLHTLTLTYTFHVWDETTSAADIRAGTGGSSFNYGPASMERISSL